MIMQADTCPSEGVLLPTIRILPETTERIIFVCYTGVVRRTDYQEIFEIRLKESIAQHGHSRLLVLYDPAYRGWEEDAAIVNFTSIMTYGPNLERLAYVNPPDHKIFHMKLIQPILGGALRFFDADKYDDARAWIVA